MSGIIADMAKEWNRAEFDAMLAAAKACRYKKYEVAEKLGVPASTLSDWVKGKHAPHRMFQLRFEAIRKEMERRPRKAKK